MRNIYLPVIFFIISTVLGFNEHYNEHKRLHERFKRQNEYNPFNPDFGSNLQKQIADQIAQIQQKVNQELAPIRRMQIKASMALGQGGTTVVTYGGKKIVFITNSIRSICPSDVNRPEEKVAECTTKLIPDNNTDPCSLGTSYSRYNNIFCFGKHSSLFCENDACECVNGKNYTITDLKQICGEEFDSNNYVHYEYYPNIYDPNMIDIKSIQDMRICENIDDWHCEWHDSGFPFVYKK